MKHEANKFASMLFLLPFSTKRKINKSVKMYVRKSIKKLGIVFLAGIQLSASLSFHISAGHYDSAAGGHICDHSYYTFADKTIIGGVRGRYYWMDPNLPILFLPAQTITICNWYPRLLGIGAM